MKTKILVVIVSLCSVNCFCHDNNTLVLQQVEFNDKTLERIIIDMSKSECFKKNSAYLMNFFISSFSNGEYFLSLEEFVLKSKGRNDMLYFVLIKDITFFVSDNAPPELFTILLTKRKFYIKNNPPSQGGDYNFLLKGTLNGYYKIIYQTCDE
jgi:hypothetical protein